MKGRQMDDQEKLPASDAVLDSAYVNGDLIDYDDNGNPLEAD